MFPVNSEILVWRDYQIVDLVCLQIPYKAFDAAQKLILWAETTGSVTDRGPRAFGRRLAARRGSLRPEIYRQSNKRGHSAALPGRRSNAD